VQPIEPVALLNILWMVKWAFVVRRIQAVHSYHYIL
jgi:hypothetical protein